MSIKYQINNILHSIKYNKNGIANINYIPANCIYDNLIDSLISYSFINYRFIAEKNLPYSLTMVNDVHQIINTDNQMLKKMYSNKIIFFHENIFSGMKKEDQYLLYNTLKTYPIFSYIKNLPIPNVNYISYGIESKILKTKASEREIDIIVLYSKNHKQSDMVFKTLSSRFNNIRAIYANNLSITNLHNTLNNAKICIDLSSYYNTLFSISCGCYGITNSISSDSGFISSVSNMDQVIEIIPKILKEYNDAYIESTQNYIESNYNYNNFINQIRTIIDTHINTSVIL